MYNIGICDDDSAYIEYLTRLFQEQEGEIVVCRYLSGEELIQDMQNQGVYDLLILDLMMPGMDGNETARKFREQFPDALLVFCSGVCLPTVESFETTPFRYWLKQYTEEKMKLEIGVVLAKMRKKRENNPVFMVKKGSSLVKLPADRIYYIAIAKKGTVFYGSDEDETYTSAGKLSEYYEQLKDAGFAYAHNSYIVNLKYVSMVTMTELEFVNGKKLTVSRSRAKEFRKAFAADVAQKYER